ncbi:MAG TPA: phosphopantetheine-binding protein [Polyangia bacterium]|jgi:acyl carrier protein
MSEDIERAVEEFLRARFRVRPDDAEFNRDVNLWEAGYVDSVGVIELIAFLERTFAIALPEEILFDPDFTHIRGIARLVARFAVDAA